MRKDLSILFLRVGISAIFLYFGIWALQDPIGQATVWLDPQMAGLITMLMPVKTFMLLLGVAQVAVALSCMLGIYARYGSALGALLLLGIIVNLGFNDIALRDFAIFTGHIFVVINGGGRYVLVDSKFKIQD